MNTINHLTKELKALGIKVNVSFGHGWYYVTLNDSPEPARFSSPLSVENHLRAMLETAKNRDLVNQCETIAESLTMMGVPISFSQYAGNIFYVIIAKDFTVELHSANDLHSLLCALLKVKLQ